LLHTNDSGAFDAPIFWQKHHPGAANPTAETSRLRIQLTSISAQLDPQSKVSDEFRRPALRERGGSENWWEY
jgi:hypothetical protein